MKMYAKIITTERAWCIASHYDPGDKSSKDKGTANNTFFNRIKFLKSEGCPLVCLEGRPLARPLLCCVSPLLCFAT